MKVKIKKLHPDAIIPKYATSGSSGFDLVATEDVYFIAGETKLVPIGLAMEIERGYELQIRPRSGLSLKTSLRVANSPATIDSDFRGQICVIITDTDYAKMQSSNRYESIRRVAKGDRIAQGVICPIIQVEFEEVESLDETDRGSGGFGSSGMK